MGPQYDVRSQIMLPRKFGSFLRVLSSINKKILKALRRKLEDGFVQVWKKNPRTSRLQIPVTALEKEGGGQKAMLSVRGQMVDKQPYGKGLHHAPALTTTKYKEIEWRNDGNWVFWVLTQKNRL